MNCMKPKYCIFCFLVTITSAYMLSLLHSPAVNDSEYQTKLCQLNKIVRENRSRKSILFLGSSRVTYAVKPDVVSKSLEQSDENYSAYNFSMLGSGLIMQRVVLHRLLESGFRPTFVVVEFWPAFLREDGPYHEFSRYTLTRFGSADARFLTQYRDECSSESDTQDRYFKNVAKLYQRSILTSIDPKLLNRAHRVTIAPNQFDLWGHCSLDNPLIDTCHDALIKSQKTYYSRLYSEYKVSPMAIQAFFDICSECAELDIPVCLLYLPESPMFLEWIPPSAQSCADGVFQNVIDLTGCFSLDLRGLVQNGSFFDAIHVHTDSASLISQVLARRLFCEVLYEKR